MSDALVTETALHGGRHLVIRHNSSATQTRMEFHFDQGFHPGIVPLVNTLRNALGSTLGNRGALINTLGNALGGSSLGNRLGNHLVFSSSNLEFVLSQTFS